MSQDMRIAGWFSWPVSKARLVITAVVVEGRSQSEVARAYGVSQPWVSRLVARYRAEGEAAFTPRSRRPTRSPAATSPEVVELVLRLRKQLSTGPRRRRPYPVLAPGRAPSAAGVGRDGVADPEPPRADRPGPEKRPRSSYLRFEAELPNQMGRPSSPTTASPPDPVEALMWRC